MVVRAFLFTFVVVSTISAAASRSYGIATVKSFLESARAPQRAATAVEDHQPVRAIALCSTDSTIACGDGDGFVCLEHICDGIDDCLDGSDEQSCESMAIARCSGQGSMACADGVGFVCTNQLCDDWDDCLDGSDELICGEYGPTPEPKCVHDTSFVCSDGEEDVCMEKMCDGAEDCSDGSDEQGCDGHQTTPVSGATSEAPTPTYTPEAPTHTPASAAPIPDPTHTPASLAPIPDPTHTPASVAPIPDPTHTPASVAPIPDPTHTPASVAPTPDPTHTPDAPSYTLHKVCLGDSSFVCTGGSEVCADQVCDGQHDCEDGSDEQTCGHPSSPTTSYPSLPTSSRPLPVSDANISLSLFIASDPNTFSASGVPTASSSSSASGIPTSTTLPVLNDIIHQSQSIASAASTTASPSISVASTLQTPPSASGAITSQSFVNDIEDSILMSLSPTQSAHAEIVSPLASDDSRFGISSASSDSIASSSSSAPVIPSVKPTVFEDPISRGQSMVPEASTTSIPLISVASTQPKSPTASGAHASQASFIVADASISASLDAHAESFPELASYDPNLKISFASGVPTTPRSPSTLVIPASSTPPVMEDLINLRQSITTDALTASSNSISVASTLPSFPSSIGEITSNRSFTASGASILLSPLPSVGVHAESIPPLASDDANFETSEIVSDTMLSASTAFSTTIKTNSLSVSDVPTQQSPYLASNTPIPQTLSIDSRVTIAENVHFISTDLTLVNAPIASDAHTSTSPSSLSDDHAPPTLTSASFVSISNTFPNEASTSTSPGPFPFSAVETSTPLKSSHATSFSSTDIMKSLSPHSTYSTYESKSNLFYTSSSTPSAPVSVGYSTPRPDLAGENDNLYNRNSGSDVYTKPITYLAFDSFIEPSSSHLAGISTASSVLPTTGAPTSSIESSVSDASTASSLSSDSEGHNSTNFSPSSGSHPPLNFPPFSESSTRSDSLLEFGISTPVVPPLHVIADTTTSSPSATTSSHTLSSILSALVLSTQSVLPPDVNVLTSLSPLLTPAIHSASSTISTSVLLDQFNPSVSGFPVVQKSFLAPVFHTTPNLLLSDAHSSPSSTEDSAATLLNPGPDSDAQTSWNLPQELDYIPTLYQSRDLDASTLASSLYSIDIVNPSVFVTSEASIPQSSPDNLDVLTLQSFDVSVTPSAQSVPPVSKAHSLSDPSLSSVVSSQSSFISASEVPTVTSTSPVSFSPSLSSTSSVPFATLPTHIPVSSTLILPTTSRTSLVPSTTRKSINSTNTTASTFPLSTNLPAAPLALTSSAVPTEPEVPTLLSSFLALDVRTPPKPPLVSGSRTVQILNAARNIPPWSFRSHRSSREFGRH